MITFQDFLGTPSVLPFIKSLKLGRTCEELSSAEIQLVGAVAFLHGQKHIWLFRLDVNTNWRLVTRLHGGGAVFSSSLKALPRLPSEASPAVWAAGSWRPLGAPSHSAG